MQFKAGDCKCMEGYAGRKCDTCAFGFHNYPQCKPIDCSAVTSGKCESERNIIKSKENGSGRYRHKHLNANDGNGIRFNGDKTFDIEYKKESGRKSQEGKMGQSKQEPCVCKVFAALMSFRAC